MRCNSFFSETDYLYIIFAHYLWSATVQITSETFVWIQNAFFTCCHLLWHSFSPVAMRGKKKRKNISSDFHNVWPTMSGDRRRRLRWIESVEINEYEPETSNYVSHWSDTAIQIFSRLCFLRLWCTCQHVTTRSPDWWSWDYRVAPSSRCWWVSFLTRCRARRVPSWYFPYASSIWSSSLPSLPNGTINNGSRRWMMVSNNAKKQGEKRDIQLYR